jgi:SAM-dependent methyltransferase
MAEPEGPDRVRGRKVSLAGAKDRIADFFAGRSQKRDARNPYVSVIYQDDQPDLAMRRDLEEKALILPRLDLRPDSAVLDVGCGVGRWADALEGLVARYLGVDFSPEMIALAQARHDGAVAEFRVLAAQDVSAQALGERAFDRAIVAGVFIYMDDEEIVRCLSGLREVLAPDSLIYLREPLAVEERLTLNGVWSEQLQQTYYAIYRTREELAALLTAGLGLEAPPAFTPLYGDAGLNNRDETRQFYCLIEGGDS